MKRGAVGTAYKLECEQLKEAMLITVSSQSCPSSMAERCVHVPSSSCTVVSGKL